MPWFEARSVFDSLRPVYLATKIFLVHFETLDFGQQTVQQTLLDQLRYIVAILLDIAVVYRCITVNTPYLYLTDSVLLNVGCYTTLVFLALLSSSIPVWNRHKAVEILEVYKNIDECDRILRSLGVVIDHRKQRMFSTLYVVGWIGVPIIITLNAFRARFDSAWTNVSSAAPDVMIAIGILRTSSCYSLFICYSTLTLMSINQRFSCVQQCTMTVLEVPKSSQGAVSCAAIRRIASAHDRLSDCIELLNNCYSIHIFYTVTMSVFFTILVVFQLIHAYATEANESMLGVAKNNIVYDQFHILVFIVMVVYTSLVGRNCHRISVMIHKSISYGSFDKRVLKELRCFSQQLQHHAPKINCGVLDFDWMLFYSVAGTFTTYLIILLQFDVGNLGFHRLHKS
nr:gustatory receptor 25 [Aedes aegypti]